MDMRWSGMPNCFYLKRSHGVFLLVENCCKVSHEENPALLSMKYWLFNRDPYNRFL